MYKWMHGLLYCHLYRWIDLRRPDIVAYFRHQIKRAFHVTDRDILIFGGCQNKTWPRKDIDAMLILEDLVFVDSFIEGEFEKLIWEVGETVWLRTNRKVAGDLWVYLPLRGELWHKGYHLDGYAKELVNMDFSNLPDSKHLVKNIFESVKDALISREIYPY